MEFFDYHPAMENLLTEVLESLGRDPKRIHPKFFYDQRGSSLFEQITDLPEYYLTKSEIEILTTQGKEIADRLGENLLVVEYGCGSSEKIHLLLNFLKRPHSYVAIEMAKKPLLDLTASLSRDYPALEIIAVCADFTRPIKLPLNGKHGSLPRLAFFPGSSIGNFEPSDAVGFLQNIRSEMGPNGGLLIGVDLKKKSARLHRAYNDSAGITDAFNKNLLARLNRECSANFDLEDFDHRAFYNEAAGRIEMHLVSRRKQRVLLGKRELFFARGETIHTESSYKYHIEEFQELAQRAGWKPKSVWTDSQELFSLQYFASTAVPCKYNP
jgi:dimethylhistidine N-methyltransferase